MKKILHTMKNIAVNSLKVITAIIITIVAILIGIWVMLLDSHHKHEKYIMNSQVFSKEKWNDIHCNRIGMYNDLERTFLSKAPSMNEVNEKLGETNMRRMYNTPNGKVTCLEYDMGAVSGFFDTSFYLVICPDERGMYMKSYKLLNGYFEEGEGVVFLEKKNREY